MYPSLVHKLLTVGGTVATFLFRGAGGGGVASLGGGT